MILVLSVPGKQNDRTSIHYGYQWHCGIILMYIAVNRIQASLAEPNWVVSKWASFFLCTLLCSSSFLTRGHFSQACTIQSIMSQGHKHATVHFFLDLFGSKQLYMRHLISYHGTQLPYCPKDINTLPFSQHFVKYLRDHLDLSQLETYKAQVLDRHM